MDISSGQVWSFRSRPHELDARVTIGPIEGDTIHVALSNLSICGPNGNVVPRVGHLPVQRASLLGSLLELQSTGPVPADVHEGIATWREARGGVFTTPLAKIVDTVEWGMSSPTAILDHQIREMRRLRTDPMIDLVMRTVRRQPQLVFLSHPDNPRGPLFWQFEGRSLCVVAFTESSRAHDFVSRHQLDSELITPPSADAAFEFLLRLHVDDQIEWASINAGHECNLPYYLDQLRR